MKFSPIIATGLCLVMFNMPCFSEEEPAPISKQDVAKSEMNTSDQATKEPTKNSDGKSKKVSAFNNNLSSLMGGIMDDEESRKNN